MGFARYIIKRGVFLVVTLILAIYAIVLISNFGGFIDNILRAEIRFNVNQQCQADPECRNLDPVERGQIINATVARLVEARGLNEPFLPKSIRYTFDALRFDLGDSTRLQSASGSNDIGVIIMERLPRSLILFFTGDIIAAAFGIWLGMKMARRALSVADRGLTVLSISTFVVPPWVFGLYFILIFAFALRWVPPGGFLTLPPPTDPFLYFLDFLHHLALPLGTIVFAFFGSWSYTTRNLVLQIMDEDFVVAGRAKGLSEGALNRKYVLRAASPPLVTALALTLIASWFGAIITETVFEWPGVGRLYYDAILQRDAPVIIALNTLFAFLLVATVFLLDLTYGLLDPRIRAARGG